MTASLETSTVEGRGWATHCPWLWQLQGSERLAFDMADGGAKAFHGASGTQVFERAPFWRQPRSLIWLAPSADELAWFCTNGRAHACPSYRRHVAAGAAP